MEEAGAGPPTRPPRSGGASASVPSQSDLSARAAVEPEWGSSPTLPPPTLPPVDTVVPALVPQLGGPTAPGYGEPTVPRTMLRSLEQRPMRLAGNVAIGGVCLVLAATVFEIVSLVARWRTGVRWRDGDTVSRQRLVELDERVELAMLVGAGALVLAGVCFMVWFHRAHRNLKAMGRGQYGPGWAIAGWFVPILNLVRPFQMASELVRESPHDRSRTRGFGLVLVWWLLFLVTSFGIGAVGRIEAATIDDLIRWDMVQIGVDAAWIVTGLVLIRVIAVVTRAQDAWFDASVPVASTR